MQFYRNSTITYPFTALYFGYIADLGPDPKLYANLYSMATSQLLEFDSIVDILEIKQVSDEVLFVGTVFINKLGNSLDVGEYRLKISVQTPSNIIDLLYLPIDIVNSTNKFHVSYLEKDSDDPNNLRHHLRNIIDPGIKHGFSVTPSAESFFYDVSAGDMCTRNGCKIGHNGTNKAFKVDTTTEFPRIDALCIYYDETKLDKNGDPSLPYFRVIKGLEDGLNIPPTIPPNYNVIRYAIVPAHTSSPTQITLSNVNPIPGRRPFFNMPSVDIADGLRSSFEFPIEFVKGTSEVQVDGVPQVRDEDYREIYIGYSKSKIEFIGDVPEAGQRVTMSGQRNNGPYYDYDYSVYITPAPITPATITHSRVGLAAEFLGEMFIESSWIDTAGTSSGFKAYNNTSTPIKGWNGTLGHYVAMSSNVTMSLPQSSALLGDVFTIVAKIDLRDAPQSPSWTRLLKVPGCIQIYVVNTEVGVTFIADYGNTRVIREVPRWHIDSSGSGTLSLSRTSTGELSLKYDSFPITEVGVAGIPFVAEAITLGQNIDEIPAPGITCLITKVLFYNRALTNPELDSI